MAATRDRLTALNWLAEFASRGTSIALPIMSALPQAD
jgi:hypothetical protein